MFTPEIVSLRQFYATALGERMRALIERSVHELWPEAKGDVIVGIGYPLPYLEPYLADCRVMIAMPAQQGAAYWPQSKLNMVFLTHEAELPLPENSVNRILLVHSIENSEQLSGMMEEIWRVLTPGGRVMAIVPNRIGAWSRSSRSPFGHGRPFSMMQLRHLMSEHRLTPLRHSSALFIPPLHWRLLWRAAFALDLLGKLFCPFVGGVLLLEAEKQLYAATRQPVVSARRNYLPIPAVVKPALGRKNPHA